MSKFTIKRGGQSLQAHNVTEVGQVIAYLLDTMKDGEPVAITVARNFRKAAKATR